MAVEYRAEDDTYFERRRVDNQTIELGINYYDENVHDRHSYWNIYITIFNKRKDMYSNMDKKIMNMAQSLMEGKIERRPVKGTEDACKNCDYKTVCGYEKGKSSTVVRKYSPKNALELMGYKADENNAEEEKK